jgi:uncharacterized membrane protein
LKNAETTNSSATNPPKPAGWGIALTAYIFMVGCLIGMSMNSDARTSFGRFHLRQAFLFHLIFHGMLIFLYFLEKKYLFDLSLQRLILILVYLGLLFFGLIAVANKKRSSLPWIGERPQKWFTFIP